MEIKEGFCSLEAYPVSSLEKVFTDRRPPRGAKRPTLEAFWEETVSFQIAYYLQESGNSDGRDGRRASVTVEGADDALEIRVRQVLEVPCQKSRNQTSFDEDYLFRDSRPAPDLLRDLKASELSVPAGRWQSLWVDICPRAREKNHGVRFYQLAIQLTLFHSYNSVTENVIFCDVRVLPKRLPSLRIPHTEWFHCDGIVDYYGIAAFRPAFWKIFGNFLEVYVKRGGNTLLTPLLTPPLDTEVGMERTTIQLVEVVLADGEYVFDFANLERFLDISLEKGIEYFEICHLFTQWGAEAAPKVVARVDGKEQRIFGWETPSDDPEYLQFLEKLLPALRQVLERRGLLEHTFFHISDEPNLGSVHYQRAQEVVRGLLAGCTIIEAVTDYQCFEKGLVDIPVCATSHIAPFLEKRPPKLWSYYCCAQVLEMPNRFIALPSWRNRIYGVLLYWYALDGFLHWGFNYYNSERSKTHINPYETTSGDGGYPPGDPFLVYPGENGVPEESIRIMVQEEAINDYRALCLLESYIGREQVLSIIRKEAGMELSFRNYPREERFLLCLRSYVNERLEEMLQNNWKKEEEEK